MNSYFCQKCPCKKGTWSQALRVAAISKSPLSTVNQANLVVYRPEIVDISQQKQTAGAEVDQSGQPFAHIHAVNTEKAEEGEEQPGYIVIDLAFVEANICVPVHSRDEEEINDPTDEKQTQGEKVEGSGNRFAIIEAMGAEETEDPEKIADKS